MESTVLIIIALVMVGANIFQQVQTGRRDSKMIRDLLDRTMAKDYSQYVQGQVAQAPEVKRELTQEERAFLRAQAEGLPVD